MSPRPRKASDEEVFAATQRVMARCAPGDLSLAAIAAEAGVTAGALVQRFGSKRELLAAVVGRWVDELPAALHETRRLQASPLAALEYYADCIAGIGATPRALANHLTYLQLDLTDPALAEPIRRSAVIARSAVEDWLAEGVALGELKPETDAHSLARLVEATIGGSLLSWARHRQGTASSWVRLDLQQLLAPYRH
jgi:AcrR family transcriptional regulator